MIWLKLPIYKLKKSLWILIKMPDINSILKNGYKHLANSSSKSSKLDAELLLSSVLKKNIKEIFTKVLKGHIAIATADLNKNFNGKLLDPLARRYLIKSGLDYEHGTGHGVGYFLNVHEGPQGITKNNKIKLKEGIKDAIDSYKKEIAENNFRET